MDLPVTGIKPGSPALQADSLPAEPPGKPLTSPRAGVGLTQDEGGSSDTREGWPPLDHKSVLELVTYKPPWKPFSLVPEQSFLPI